MIMFKPDLKLEQRIISSTLPFSLAGLWSAMIIPSLLAGCGGAVFEANRTPHESVAAEEDQASSDLEKNEPEDQAKVLPPSGRHGHFLAMLEHANLDKSYTLREQAQYNEYSNGGQTGDNPSITYDSSLDAAMVTIRSGAGSLPIQDYLRLPFTRIVKGDGTSEVSIQWDARWDQAYVNADANGLNNHKSFRLDLDPFVGEKRRIELQTRFMNGEASDVALPTIRVYGYDRIGGDGSADPLRVGSDMQPGGVSGFFRIRPNTWTRFTLSITYTGDEQRIRLWIADEDLDPVLVIADPVDSTKGFLIDHTTASYAGLNQFLVLHNTSQEGTTNPDLHSWVRNVLIFREATVPLGGRPVR